MSPNILKAAFFKSLKTNSTLCVRPAKKLALYNTVQVEAWDLPRASLHFQINKFALFQVVLLISTVQGDGYHEH